MRIENDITSLETSQKLKELGFPQKTYFYWLGYPVHTETHWVIVDRDASDLEVQSLPRCASPILTEVLEDLPKEIEGGYSLFLDMSGRQSIAYYSDFWQMTSIHGEGRSTRPVESVALLWLELHKK